MRAAKRLPIVGVMGSGTEEYRALADEVGKLLAGLNVHLLTGGGQGVMLAVTRAFVEAPDRGSGLAIGILPCLPDDAQCPPKPGYPNPFVEVVIATHLSDSGERGTQLTSRNHINVLSSDVIVALPGGTGTQSEARLALCYKKPIIAFFSDGLAIPKFDPSIPVARTIQEVEQFLRSQLQATLR